MDETKSDIHERPVERETQEIPSPTDSTRSKEEAIFWRTLTENVTEEQLLARFMEGKPFGPDDLEPTACGTLLEDTQDAPRDLMVESHAAAEEPGPDGPAARQATDATDDP